MKKLEWTTKKVMVKELIKLEFNPRKITEDKRKKLIESLEKFNLVEIPAVNTDMKIIGGNQRVTALLLAGRGEEEIDVRYPNRKLSDKEVKEYCIISNTHAGEFDFDMLEMDFADINFADIGFDLAGLDAWGIAKEKKAKKLEAKEDDYDVPEGGIETEIVLGDLFEIGEHRLLCGDSRDSDQVAKLMNGEKADMVFTDPPYNVKINNIVNSGKVQHYEFKMASGELSINEFIDFLTSVFNNLIIFSKNGSIHYICMDWKHIFEIISAGRNCYSQLKNLCIWNKDNGGMGTFYRSKHELIFVFKNGTEKNINNFELGQHGRYRTNVWDYASINSFSNRERIGNRSVGHSDLDYHPTVKPIPLVADAILDCSNENNVIVDLFLGSGTTMIASHQLKRKCYGMELDPKYCQVIIDRMLKLDNTLVIKRNGELWNTQKTS